MRTAISISLLSALALAGCNPAANDDRATTAAVSGEKNCRRLPAGKPILKLQLKPGSDIRDVINWMGMISCADFDVTGLDLRDKRVTVPPSSEPMTLEAAYALFRQTLATVGLTVDPTLPEAGKTVRILPKT